MNPIAGQFTSIEQVNDQYLNRQNVKQSSKTSDISFEDILRKQQNKAELQKDSGIRFSKHASQRLETRNIQLSSEQSARLEDGVMKAQEKGIKESLVLVDSLAFIVNIPNKTVVTAMDQTDAQTNVFTNIDGAIIM
jgi:flagellar operon protein|uniref:TIGR02530 family flagellar biosynthesis protein n=1 Tax=Agathobacter sp. TaxID=2021311 RepID=UPI0040262F89